MRARHILTNFQIYFDTYRIYSFPGKASFSNIFFWKNSPYFCSAGSIEKVVDIKNTDFFVMIVWMSNYLENGSTNWSHHYHIFFCCFSRFMSLNVILFPSIIDFKRNRVLGFEFFVLLWKNSFSQSLVMKSGSKRRARVEFGLQSSGFYRVITLGLPSGFRVFRVLL